jgi:hypothetical protein
MKEAFRTFNFSAPKLELIETANGIIDELQGAGYMLTLRQLYYQLVSRGLMVNKQTEYKRLGDILNDAKLAGLTDWAAIEDRTRNLESVNHWEDPSQIISAVAEQFRIDKWKEQPNRVEVWVEKDALVGVLEKACRALDVAWFSCRGYTSGTELYGAGKRLARYKRGGQQPIIIHLGDHDPSGLDMTRDITDRVSMFARTHVEVRRIALNMDQIEQYSPPPNPAKTTDCRYEKYAQEHGEESWELDALNPSTIDELITEEVLSLRDEELWEQAEQEEERHRETLALASDNWDALAAHIQKKYGN